MSSPSSIFSALFCSLLSFSCLLCFAAENATTPEEPGDNEKLIERLGAHNAEEREKAENDIWKQGDAILPLLQKATSSPDPEISERAKKLIPKIKFHIPLNESSALGDFINAYSNSSDDERNALFGQFMFRNDLTVDEARSAMLIYRESPSSENEENPPRWAVEKYGSLLNQETEKLLNQSKVKEAVELWSSIDIAPVFLRRYATMLYNSGLPLERSRFSDIQNAQIEAIMALLDNKPDKARQLLPPEGDDYISERIAAAEFNLEEKWRPILTPRPNATNCPSSSLIPLWIDSREKNDQDTLLSISRRLENAAAQFQPNQEFAVDDGSVSSETLFYGIDASKLLLFTGELDKSFDYITRNICSAKIESGPVSFVYSYTSHPEFDIRLMGAREDSRPAILELAESIIPSRLASLKIEAQKDEDNGDSMFAEITEEQTIITQKLLTLAFYLEERGEGKLILPYIVAQLKSLPKSDREFLSIHYLSSFSLSQLDTLAYHLYETIVQQNMASKASLSVYEQILFSCYASSSESFENWKFITSFIETTSSEPLAREEKTRRTLVLLGSISGKDGEKEELFEKALAYIKKSDTPELADFFAKVLLDNYYFNNTSSMKDAFRIPEELGRAVWPEAPPTRRPELAGDLEMFASDALKKSYHDFYRSHLSKSRLFSPSLPPAPIDEEESHENSSDFHADRPSPMAEYGEYLAASARLAGKTEESDSLKKRSRLYAASEDRMRAMNSLLLGSPFISSQEFIREISPAFVTGSEYRESYDEPDFSASWYGLYSAAKLALDGKTSEVCYLMEASAKELLTFPFLGSLSPKTVYGLKGACETYRGFLLWEKGEKEQALAALALSRKMLFGSNGGFFYHECLRRIPEQRETFEKWYEEDRQKTQKLLRTWPNYVSLRDNLISSSLAVGKHLEETEKMIRDIPDKANRDKMLLLSQMVKEYQKGNRDEAKKLSLRLMMEAKDPNEFSSSLYYELWKKHAPEI